MELSPHYLIYILPYVLGLAVIEIAWHYRRGRAYAWGDTLASLVVNLIRRITVVGLSAKLVLLLGSRLSDYKLFDLPVVVDGHWSVRNAVFLFIAYEVVYYWFHRWSHEVRWLWASHSVHHSPNKINFLTAERLAWTGGFARALLLVTPLILLGFDVKAVTIASALDLLYQYWLHTEMIGRLGWLEWVFNTPSHHRVHHASNVAYLDANYGGVLIVFDRLFGTFIGERPEEPIVYGLVKPLYSFNPITIAFHEWVAIASDLSRSWHHPRLLWGYLFGPPGWSPDGSRKTSKQMRADLASKRAA